MRFLFGHKWMALVIIIVAAAVVLSAMSALSPGIAIGSSDWLGGLLKPFQTSVGSISNMASSFWTSGRRIAELEAENAALRRHVAEIDEQARLYDQIISENERLRELLGFAQRHSDLSLLPAAVIARDTDNYAKTYTISRGSRHGIEPRMLAVNEMGQIVGTVSEAGVDWATVRTVVDSDFACGAYVFRSRIDGVCKGSFGLMNEEKLTMTGLTPDVDIKVGDEVLTSGVGGMFPRDIVIGEVIALEFDLNGMTATAIISPAAELKRIEQLFIVMSFESEE